MSKCPGTNVPGFTESEEVVKQNRGLSTKITALISDSDVAKRSMVKWNPVESAMTLKETEMSTAQDNYANAKEETKIIARILSENYINYRINKDGTVTIFMPVGKGKNKVIKGVKTLDDMSRKTGIPNPYEEYIG